MIEDIDYAREEEEPSVSVKFQCKFRKCSGQVRQWGSTGMTEIICEMRDSCLFGTCPYTDAGVCSDCGRVNGAKATRCSGCGAVLLPPPKPILVLYEYEDGKIFFEYLRSPANPSEFSRILDMLGKRKGMGIRERFRKWI